MQKIGFCLLQKLCAKVNIFAIYFAGRYYENWICAGIHRRPTSHLPISCFKKIYQEKISGAQGERKEPNKMLEDLREGDTLVVWRLDRLARSTRQLLEITDRINSVGAHFRSLSESWADTTSHAGRMVMTIFSGIAEFERDLIKERTSVGRESAKKRGVKFGRSSKLNPEQRNLIKRLLSEGESIKSIAKSMNAHPSTVYRSFETQ